nr:hypothetical protein [Tellurirhabdus bombi]
MKSKRLYFLLSPSTPRTDAIDFGLWPTPTTAAANQGMNQPDGRRGQTLIGAAKGQMWPTVRANMTGGVSEGRLNDKFNNLEKALSKALLPTPTVMDTGATTELSKLDARRAKAKASKINGNGFGQTLGELAQRNLIPTPQAAEGHKLTGLENQNSTTKVVRELTGQTGQLNPHFVLEMMGFPPDWTDLPVGDPMQLKLPGMP